MSVALSFLGGLGEVGRNCTLLEVEGRLALVVLPLCPMGFRRMPIDC